MQLAEYFEKTRGTGILSTADGQGRVNAAVFARPRVLDDGSLALIMLERLTHRNLGENPYAHYLFLEEGPGYRGVRLALRKINESSDPELLRTLSRRHPGAEEELAKGPKFLVFFAVERILNLVGGDSLAQDS